MAEPVAPPRRRDSRAGGGPQLASQRSAAASGLSTSPTSSYQPPLTYPGNNSDILQPPRPSFSLPANSLQKLGVIKHRETKNKILASINDLLVRNEQAQKGTATIIQTNSGGNNNKNSTGGNVLSLSVDGIDLKCLAFALRPYNTIVDQHDDEIWTYEGLFSELLVHNTRTANSGAAGVRRNALINGGGGNARAGRTAAPGGNALAEDDGDIDDEFGDWQNPRADNVSGIVEFGSQNDLMNAGKTTVAMSDDDALRHLQAQQPRYEMLLGGNNANNARRKKGEVSANGGGGGAFSTLKHSVSSIVGSRSDLGGDGKKKKKLNFFRT